LVFLLVEVVLFVAELFGLETESLDFDWSVLALASLLIPTAFAPAPSAPPNAPVAAPMTTSLATSVKASVAFAITPFEELFTFFFAEELLAVDDLEVDFAAGLADLLVAADFELAPDDLLAVAFEPELDDLPADDFDAPPVDLPAVDFPAEDDLLAAGFAAVFEAEDLLVDADFAADVFAAGLAEADLPPEAEGDLLAVVLLLVVVDFAEFLFVVAIAVSLKFFLQLTQEFLR
jgi:hypothetical protein